MPKVQTIRPMLAVDASIDSITYPVATSVKLDGIRAIVIDSVVMSRSMKPIRNRHVQRIYGKPEYNGFDGELIVGDIYSKDVFQKTTSGVMSADGEPDVRFYVFDDVSQPELGYLERQRLLIARINETFKSFDPTKKAVGAVYYLPHVIVNSKEGLVPLLERERISGGEGLIIRGLNSPYKFGRSTKKEGGMLKLKFFEQDEFMVIGIEEKYMNTNPKEINELGYSERSDHKEGMVPCGTLGSLVLKYGFDGSFKVGTGFDDALRQEIWDNKDKYLGKLASVRYMSVGAKDKPRVPSFIGFRSEDDL